MMCCSVLSYRRSRSHELPGLVIHLATNVSARPHHSIPVDIWYIVFDCTLPYYFTLSMSRASSEPNFYAEILLVGVETRAFLHYWKPFGDHRRFLMAEAIDCFSSWSYSLESSLGRLPLRVFW